MYKISYFIFHTFPCFMSLQPITQCCILNQLASSFNYSTHSPGTKSRNRNNKELKYLKLIRFYIHSTQKSEPILKGPCSTPQLTKRDNSTFCMQWCTLNAVLRNSIGLGNSITCGQMECFLQNIPNTSILQALILISTYHVIFSQPVK